MRSVNRLVQRLLALTVVVGGGVAVSALTPQRAVALPRVLNAGEMAQTFGDGEQGKCGFKNMCMTTLNCTDAQYDQGNQTCWKCDSIGTWLTCCAIENASSECKPTVGEPRCGGGKITYAIKYVYVLLYCPSRNRNLPS